MPHTGPYRVEIHFGAGWEWLAQENDYFTARKWCHRSADWPTRIIDDPTGRIVYSQ